MENEVFNEVYKNYLGYVYKYLYGMTFNRHKAEDLTQEVFVKAFCVLDFPEEGIKSWLLTVAHNLYVDYIRKNSRIEYTGDNASIQYPARDVQSIVLEREELSNTFAYLKVLPEAQRQAVLLCLVYELPYTQAAKIMGLSVSAVTNLVYRARKTLRALRRENE